MKKIEFFFDFLSPFSYFAWLNRAQLEISGPVSFVYRPVLMGKLFDHWGIKGPGDIPPKRRLMLKSCFRQALRQGFDFIPPPEHPFNPLYCLRLATIACSEGNQEKVIAALWRHIWGEGNSGDDPEKLSMMLDAQNLEGERLMEKAFSKEAKQEIKLNTKEAIQKNIFGVPSFEFENEIFWGNDSMRDLIDFACHGDKFDQELYLDRIKEDLE